MGVAASVKTTIVVKGQDQASRPIGKATGSVGRLQQAVAGAQAQFGRMGSAVRSALSGDLAGSLSAVTQGLGGAGGLAGAAAAATAGTVAVGAAVAAAAYKFTQWSVEIERTRAALDATFGAGKGVERAVGLARTIGGVGVESVAKLATTLQATGIGAQFTAQQLQELTGRATTMGKTGDEALTAFAEAIKSGTTESLKQVGTFINSERALKAFARTLGETSAEGLTQYERQLAVVQAVQADLNRNLATSGDRFDQQDRLLGRLDVAWTQLKFSVSEYLSGPAAGVLDAVVETIETFARWGKVIGAVGSALAVTFTAQIRAAGIAIGGLTAAMATFASTGSLTKAGAILDRAALDAYNTSVVKTKDAWLAVGDAVSQGAQKIKAVDTLGAAGGLTPILQQLGAAGARAGRVTEAIGKDLAKQAAARAAAASRAASAARSKRLAEKRALDALIKRQDEQFFADLKALREQDARDAIALKRSEILAMQEVERKRAEAAAAEIKRQQQIRAERERARSAAITMATDTAVAGVNAVEQVVGANRALAGVRAGIMGAEAAFAFASGNIPVGIAKAAAAFDMARQALTSAPSVSQPAGVAAGPTGGGIPSPSPAASAGAAPVNIVINGVMTTKAEVGAALDKAMRAAKAAGMAA